MKTNAYNSSLIYTETKVLDDAGLIENEIVPTNLKIRTLPLYSINVFHKLFQDAVDNHFTYFPEAYRSKVLRDNTHLKILLATLLPSRIVLTAYIDGKLSGYALGSVPKSGIGQIYWLYVDPNQRGSNTGLALLSRMIRIQSSKGANEVMLVTHDHRKYYQRQGFKFVRIVQDAGVKLALMRFRIIE